MIYVVCDSIQSGRHWMQNENLERQQEGLPLLHDRQGGGKLAQHRVQFVPFRQYDAVERLRGQRFNSECDRIVWLWIHVSSEREHRMYIGMILVLKMIGVPL